MSKIATPILLVFFLTSCGGTDEATETTNTPHVVVTQSATSVNPFIHFLSLTGEGTTAVRAVGVLIRPKAGTFAKPVTNSYSIEYLQAKGYAGPHSSAIVIPVVGLYQNYANTIDVYIDFGNSTRTVTSVQIQTAPYVSPPGVTYMPQIVKAFDGTATLGFNYFFIKTRAGSPAVFDIDGEIRWTADGITSSQWSIFSNNKFWIASPNSLALHSQELDGTVTSRNIQSASYTNAHHNIETGKQGLLIEMDAGTGPTRNIESILAEVDEAGQVLQEWNFADIIANEMLSGGDDPSLFVRPGIDWFHMNSAIYVAADDSLIVSSRENFVIKIDYQTAAIKWIFGDPTKYWYTFPSLRSKALTLNVGGLYPVGQHALSINSKGDLQLFNNGGWSFNQPVGAPRGVARSYSAVSAYAISDQTLEAVETMVFDNQQTLLSDICSSAYDAGDGSMLVTYSVADHGYMSGNLTPRLVGIDPNGAIAFDFRFIDSNYCFFSWNANFINFEHLVFE